jgi:proline racemase
VTICKVGRRGVHDDPQSHHLWRDRAQQLSDRTLADRRGFINLPGSRSLCLCAPRAAPIALIPLTFPMHQREAGPEVVFMRPMAKCSGCGERIFAKVIARQRLPKPI